MTSFNTHDQVSQDPMLLGEFDNTETRQTDGNTTASRDHRRDGDDSVERAVEASL